jgi:hypothetical protein
MPLLRINPTFVNVAAERLTLAKCRAYPVMRLARMLHGTVPPRVNNRLYLVPDVVEACTELLPHGVEQLVARVANGPVVRGQDLDPPWVVARELPVDYCDDFAFVHQYVTEVEVGVGEDVGGGQLGSSAALELELGRILN